MRKMSGARGTRSLRWALLLSLAACATGGGAGGADPVPWSTGAYQFRTGFSTRGDTEGATGRDRFYIDGRFWVTRSGPESVRTSVGDCRRAAADVVPMDQRRPDRAHFTCGEFTLSMEPTADGVRGRVSGPVEERVRTRGVCAEHRTTSTGSRVCARWEYRVEARRTRKSASFTARPSR